MHYFSIQEIFLWARFRSRYSVPLYFDEATHDLHLRMSTVNLSRRMWWQRNIDQYWTVYANDRLHEYLYIVAAFIIPEVLALLLFILPWVRNFVENSNWRVFHALTWWFQVCTILVLLLLHLVWFPLIMTLIKSA